MSIVPRQFLEEARRLVFKGKTSESRAYHAIRHFKRSGKIFPLKPESIQIQTHSFCNGRCLYCPYPELSHKLNQGKMDRELILKIADEVTKWDTLRQVMLMLQNEPLLDKDFFETIKYFKILNPRLNLATVTNGTLLNPSVIEQILNSSLDELMISLDAFSKQTYEKLHPGFSFEKILNSIRLLSQLKTDRLSVKLSFVLTRQNHGELPGFINFAQNNRMGWRVMHVLNRANNVNNYNEFRFSRLTWKSLKLRLIYKYFYRACALPFSNMSVLFNGDVLICCNDWHRKAVIGNVNSESLDQIWNGEMMNYLRKQIIQKRYREISACSQCTLAQLCL
ncbi:MAG: radical SAM protein [Desulfobacteraceae bacterium]|nr:MAG: radical SAM protein [Desulfobacteraceae bacterium]